MLCEKCGCFIPIGKQDCPNCCRAELPIIKTRTCYIFKKTKEDGSVELWGCGRIPQLGWASLEACEIPNKWKLLKKYLRYKWYDFIHKQKGQYELWTVNLNYIEDFDFERVYAWDVINKQPMKLKRCFKS